MKDRNSNYKPPTIIGAFPSLERGHTVGCPVSTQRRTAISSGKLKLRHDDPLTTRFLCLLNKHEDCKMCPNNDFDATFENLGDSNDFTWLTDLMKTACKIADAKVVEVLRRHDDCCVKHVNCIMSRYTVRTKEGAVFNKDTSSIIYDAIMKAGEESAFDVLHVKVQRRTEREFWFVIAMVRKGDDRWKPRRKKEKEHGAISDGESRESGAGAEEEGGDQDQQDDGGAAGGDLEG